jgi:hypothetical protein
MRTSSEATGKELKDSDRAMYHVCFSVTEGSNWERIEREQLQEAPERWLGCEKQLGKN